MCTKFGLVAVVVLCCLFQAITAQPTNMGPTIMSPSKHIIIPVQKTNFISRPAMSVRVYRNLHNPKIFTEHWKKRFIAPKKELSILDQIRLSNAISPVADAAYSLRDISSKLPAPESPEAKASSPTTLQAIAKMIRPLRPDPPRNNWGPQAPRSFPLKKELNQQWDPLLGVPVANERMRAHLDALNDPSSVPITAKQHFAKMITKDAGEEEEEEADGSAMLETGSSRYVASSSHHNALSSTASDASEMIQSLGWDDVQDKLSEDEEEEQRSASKQEFDISQDAALLETQEHTAERPMHTSRRTLSKLKQQVRLQAGETMFLETASSVKAPWWKSADKVKANRDNILASAARMSAPSAPSAYTRPTAAFADGAESRFQEVNIQQGEGFAQEQQQQQQQMQNLRASSHAQYPPPQPMFQNRNPDPLLPVAWKVNRDPNVYGLTTLDILYPTLRKRLEAAEKKKAVQQAVLAAQKLEASKKKAMGFSGKGGETIINIVQPPAAQSAPALSAASMAQFNAQAAGMRLKEKQVELQVEKERSLRDMRFLAAMQSIVSRQPTQQASTTSTVVSSSHNSNFANSVAPGIPALAHSILANGVYPASYFQPAYVPNGAPALTPSDASNPSDNGSFGELKI